MKVLSDQEVTAGAVSALMLPPNTGIASPVGLAAAVRRVSALTCPCPARSIVRAVAGALDGLVQDVALVRSDVAEMIDALIAHGDLLEVRHQNETTGDHTWLIHTSPPAFVQRKSGTVMLLGVAPDEIYPLPDSYLRRIQHESHVRVIEEEPGEDLVPYLRDLGLLGLSDVAWLRMPPAVSPDTLLARVDEALDASGEGGPIPELDVLDPTRPPRFYDGRWVEPKRRTGRFVARRPQAYGRPLWCYVELADGQPGRLLDLPLEHSASRGCDEAWRLQAAIDQMRGQPQQVRVRRLQNAVVLDFFSPLPQWAERRLKCVGREARRHAASLLSFEIPSVELEEQLDFLHEHLWLQSIEGV